ncbi:putative mitochondrial group I intron splicing factor CCM1 [[Candida] jaroonii]|uniref:Mitochondrial group I intron splicing factor CCM1 n=1 Tax=[Candida] jaroonii TaxID=467808 RepID=A0ACA9YGI9_9ASCO|nr:putative mitochondrial group I intron splicing factor CCM1 [[Candida] jaroonii]
MNIRQIGGLSILPRVKVRYSAIISRTLHHSSHLYNSLHDITTKSEEHSSTSSFKYVNLAIQNRRCQKRSIPKPYTTKSEVLDDLKAINEMGISDERSEEIFTLFNKMIGLSHTYNDLIPLMCDIWTKVFTQDFPSIQKKLITRREIFVHALMNTKRFDDYRNCIQPLVEAGTHDSQVYDTLIQILKFNGKFYDMDGILKYLRSDGDINQKRMFINRFLISNEIDDEVMKDFFKMLRIVDGTCLLTEEDHKHYQASVEKINVAIVNSKRKDFNLNKLRTIMFGCGFSNKAYFNFLSSMIKLGTPKNSLKIFKFKFQKYLCKETILADYDITNAMKTLYELGRYKACFDLYKYDPKFNNEDQFAILMETCVKQKDWLNLQVEFDDLYGRGNLPYAVHYSIVMNALAELGSVNDVDRLYQQLLKRRMTPNMAIYKALIKVRVNNNEFAEAQEIFNKYHRQFKDSSSVYSLISKEHFNSSNYKKLMILFITSVKKEKAEGIKLINSEFVLKLIKSLQRNYAFKEIEEVNLIVKELLPHLIDDEFFNALGESYIKFNQFEMVEALVNEAKIIHNIPEEKLYSLQLRNYRHWEFVVTNKYQRGNIDLSRRYIINKIDNELISNNPKLCTEVIKHLINEGYEGRARGFLKKVINLNKPREQFFLPLMKYNLHLNDESYLEENYKPDDSARQSANLKQRLIKLNKKNLNLFKQMVSLEVPVTMKTYDVLMQSITYVDKFEGNDFSNSIKLMQSILDISGMKLEIPLQGNFNQFSNLAIEDGEISDFDWFENSSELFKISMFFVNNVLYGKKEKNKFLVGTLKSLGSMNNDMPLYLRLCINQEMGRFYKRLDNVNRVMKITDKGLSECQKIIKRFSTSFPLRYENNGMFRWAVPQELKKHFEDFISLKIRILQYQEMKNQQSNQTSFPKLLRIIKENEVAVNGVELNFIISKVLGSSVDYITSEVLPVIEDHLANNGLNEISMKRQIQYLYKLFSILMINKIGMKRFSKEYEILTQHYEIDIVSNHDKIMIRRIKSQFSNGLKTFNTRFPEFSAEESLIFSNPFKFFYPERSIKTVNKLNYENSYKLLKTLENLDKYELFDLMDKYPLTIELIMLNDKSMNKIIQFRNAINKIIPCSTMETKQERFERTMKALHVYSK